MLENHCVRALLDIRTNPDSVAESTCGLVLILMSHAISSNFTLTMIGRGRHVAARLAAMAGRRGLSTSAPSAVLGPQRYRPAHHNCRPNPRPAQPPMRPHSSSVQQSGRFGSRSTTESSGVGVVGFPRVGYRYPERPTEVVPSLEESERDSAALLCVFALPRPCRSCSGCERGSSLPSQHTSPSPYHLYAPPPPQYGRLRPPPAGRERRRNAIHIGSSSLARRSRTLQTPRTQCRACIP